MNDYKNYTIQTLRIEFRQFLIRHPRLYSFIRKAYRSKWYVHNMGINRKALQRGIDETFLTMVRIFSAHGSDYCQIIHPKKSFSRVISIR